MSKNVLDVREEESNQIDEIQWCGNSILNLNVNHEAKTITLPKVVFEEGVKLDDIKNLKAALDAAVELMGDMVNG